MDVNEELKFFVKVQKKIGWGSVGGGQVGLGRVWGGRVGGGGGGQGGSERIIEVFVKIQKKK